MGAIQLSQSPDGAPIFSVTARTPTNIAVIKYWGKRDEALILPLNSSLSVTLDPNDLAATTTVAISPAFEEDKLWLNGKEVSISDSVRYQNCLRAVRERAQGIEAGGEKASQEQLRSWRIHVASRNNFPTAAGLASSAAGFACLVFSLAQLLGVTEERPGDLSAIARLGSGSACRSLYGGFVRWNMGQASDGHDSIAEQVAGEEHWPDLRVLVAVVNDRQKDTSSTAGMQQSVRTSPLLLHRAKAVVPERMVAMERAIAARDFQAFGALTMADSNQFHATCLDTSPPIFYMNDASRQVIGLVEQWNAQAGEIKAAYTFDAGPNAVLFCLEADRGALLRRLLYHFPPSDSTPLNEYVESAELLKEASVSSADDIRDLPAPEISKEAKPGLQFPGELKYIMSTRVGMGPQVCEKPLEPLLLDARTGFPPVS
ncbi:diphosphomevalonate decarboxylase [Klebsormidium nitens]|uniref:Diphosphomevalonate decarboxylase n=1 Tax=Klebsormidium nitens TaxID=105231 RepID=A0A1Y1IQ62_KLENI|nr:diphosphomevalonate decarboxylase [Klebsormidium nitens]|eukprot:GAQ91371.1 diphosphomevalonate decarboxylase [Klebsormidium nitens]